MERYLLPTPDYPPKRGGVARYLAALAQTFPAIRVLVWKDVPSYGKILQDFWWRRRRFDAMVISHVLPVGTIAMMFGFFTGKPYDIILHGLDFDLARSVVRKRTVMWMVLRGARRIFTNSRALGDEVENFVHRSCLVLYPCVSDSFIEAAEMMQRNQGEKPERSHVRWLTVGRLVERKGHLKVLAAMRSLLDVTYTIVGDGPMRSEIEQFIQDHGFQDRVTLMQNVPDGKLPDLYASHDIFVMPTTKTSHDREGFGIVYLEAGLFALPVVATRQPGVDEAVLHEETGLLVDDTPDALLSALERLSSDGDLRKKFGGAARQRVLQKFTREKTMSTFVSVPSLPHLPPYCLLPTAYSLPLVSIIIPTYQHAHTIERCLKSLFAQTYPVYEIIVVNDGSTDDTHEVLRKFQHRITVIHQQNRGANVARNRGFAEAKGEFVMFVDADVLLHPSMIDEGVAMLKTHPEASYVYTGFRFGWKYFSGIPFSFERLRTMNFIHTTALVRRGDFPGFDESIKRFQDWDVWLTMAEQGKCGILLPGVWFRVLIDGPSRIGSSWLPSFVYNLPWEWIGWMPKRVRRYQEARKIILKKHQNI